MRQHEQVARLAGFVADVAPQPALLLEAELREHVEEPVLPGDDVDHELHDAELERLDDGPLGQQPADAALPVVRGDDEAELADVAAPPGFP